MKGRREKGRKEEEKVGREMREEEIEVKGRWGKLTEALLPLTHWAQQGTVQWTGTISWTS
jgi:hypothetical protein